MTQLLRMLAALPDEQNMVPRTPIGQITPIYNCRSWASHALFWFSQGPTQASTADACRYTHTLIHKRFEKFFKNILSVLNLSFFKKLYIYCRAREIAQLLESWLVFLELWVGPSRHEKSGSTRPRKQRQAADQPSLGILNPNHTTGKQVFR